MTRRALTVTYLGIVVALVGLALAFAGYATADQPVEVPRSSDPIAIPANLEKATTREARRMFRRTPCPRPTEIFNADLTWIGPGVLGASWRPQCTIAVVPLAGYRWCMARLHELAHLAGYEHTDTAALGGLMRGAGPARYPACLRAAGLTLTRAQAEKAVRGDLADAGARAERVTCTVVVDPGARRCTADGARYLVQRDEDGVTVR